MFKKLLQQSGDLLTKQQTSILSAAFIIMAMSLVSKVLGVLKLRLLIHYFGDGNQTAAFIAANRLPESFFDIIIFSILSVSFIPIFAGHLAKGENERASKLASITLNLTITIYAIAAILAFIFANQLARMLAPGFVETSPETITLIAQLTRYMLVAQFFLIIGGYLTAILQSHQRFLAPAIAMTLYNVATVLSIIFLAPTFGIYATVVGMIIGAFCQMIFQMPFLKPTKFRYSFDFSWKFPGVSQIGKLSFPRMIGVMSSQLNESVIIILASLLSAISIIAWDYALRLSAVPVGLFAAAIAQATLPALALAYAKKQHEEFQKVFLSSFNQILFFVLPISALFIVLRLPIVRLLFGDPNFTWEATVTTGRTLAFLGIGLIGQSAILLLARAFYAMQDTKTPLKAGLAAFVLNMASAYIIVEHYHLPIWWIALTFSCTTLLNAIVLLFALERKLGGFTVKGVLLTPLKLLLCWLTMIVVMYIPFRLMDLYGWNTLHAVGPFRLPPSLQVFILDTRYTANLILLTVTAGFIGFCSYTLLAMILEVEEVGLIRKALKKVGGVRQLLAKSPEIIETDHTAIR